MDPITIDQFRQALPDKVKKSVNVELINKITATLNDPDMYETYRENLLGYASIMADGRFKIANYIEAVKYVSHKLMGKTNLDAFSITFPSKISRWTAASVAPKDIASYVTAYNKSKLVNLIMEQTLTPCWVLNQDLYQKALNVQAELMVSANSEKVRSDAANSILTHLKQPETKRIELAVAVAENGSIDALRQATMELVAQQRTLIQSGVSSAQQIAHSPLLIDGDLDE